ncbi:hypothetical protein H4219_004148 [Mycoemilia scoparia]|uniref:Uncharacterized protein n=1 Tax=Mycoemilia scoparia TaxID=417184 RepID=A0A9W7ZZ70_9FUNG|nr:hypothetical protein H4219_004148 [Mycoemilia scoparia]
MLFGPSLYLYLLVTTEPTITPLDPNTGSFNSWKYKLAKAKGSFQNALPQRLFSSSPFPSSNANPPARLFTDKIYCLSLEENRERRANMQSIFDYLGLDVEYLISPMSLTPGGGKAAQIYEDMYPQLEDFFLLRKYPHEELIARYWVLHMRAWELVIKNGLSRVVVLEDDADLHLDVIGQLRRIVDILDYKDSQVLAAAAAAAALDDTANNYNRKGRSSGGYKDIQETTNAWDLVLLSDYEMPKLPFRQPRPIFNNPNSSTNNSSLGSDDVVERIWETEFLKSAYLTNIQGAQNLRQAWLKGTTYHTGEQLNLLDPELYNKIKKFRVRKKVSTKREYRDSSGGLIKLTGEEANPVWKQGDGGFVGTTLHHLMKYGDELGVCSIDELIEMGL